MSEGDNGVPQPIVLKAMFFALSRGAIGRIEAALWAERWIDWEPQASEVQVGAEGPRCSEWEREVLDAFSFAAIPTLEDGFLYGVEELCEWYETLFRGI